MVTIGAATLRDVSYILGNLNKADHAEIWCQAPDGATPAEMAAGIVVFGSAFVAYVDGAPAAAFGFSPMTPAGNVLSAWAFGTKRSARAMKAIVEFAASELMPAWLDAGVTRLEARSLASHRKAHRWMEETGAVREADIPEFGRSGEAFVLYVWRRSPQMFDKVKSYCR